MNLRLMHLLVSCLIFLATLFVLLLSILVFDVSQSIALMLYLLLLPILAAAIYPVSPDRTLSGQMFLWSVLVIPIVGCLAVSDVSRARMAILVADFYRQPDLSYAALESAYRDMPSYTARHRLRLPTGEMASQSVNWRALIDVEKKMSR